MGSVERILQRYWERFSLRVAEMLSLKVRLKPNQAMRWVVAGDLRPSGLTCIVRDTISSLHCADSQINLLDMELWLKQAQARLHET